jgi:hypothetical protein
MSVSCSSTATNSSSRGVSSSRAVRRDKFLRDAHDLATESGDATKVNIAANRLQPNFVAVCEIVVAGILAQCCRQGRRGVWQGLPRVYEQLREISLSH